MRLIRIQVHRAIFRDKHTENGVWVRDHVRVEGKQHWAKGTSWPTPPLPKPHLTSIQRKAAAKLLACAQLFQLYVSKWFKTLDRAARLPTKIVFVPAIEVCFKTSRGLPLNTSDCSEVSCGCKPITPNVLTFKASLEASCQCTDRAVNSNLNDCLSVVSALLLMKGWPTTSSALSSPLGLW